MTGTCQLAWQDGPRAIFAEAHVMVKDNGNNDLTLVLPEGMEGAWEIGVRFGLELFRECNRSRRSGCIVIENFQGQPLDTSIASAAYVAFHAIARAFNYQPGKKFEFDATTGQFILGFSDDKR